MSRYLLDTKILVFLVSGQLDNISEETRDILDDYNNQLYTSSISVTELVQLYRIKKIQQSKMFKTSSEMVYVIEKDFFIKILPFSKEHIKKLTTIKISEGHNDPFDHAIIAHSITEKLTLISSDRRFKEYIPQKLKFAFNKR